VDYLTFTITASLRKKLIMFFVGQARIILKAETHALILDKQRRGDI